MMILETERLILRQWEPDELHLVHGIVGHLPTMQFWPAPFTIQQSEGWLRRCLETYAATANTLGRWATVLKESGRVIGDCGLMISEVNGVAQHDLGIHVGQRLQHGRGETGRIGSTQHHQDGLDIGRGLPLRRNR